MENPKENESNLLRKRIFRGNIDQIPHLGKLIISCIEQQNFPHYLKIYTKNAYQRKLVHEICEKLNIQSKTEKDSPYFYFHHQGFESFDIRDEIRYPMILTITSDSLLPTPNPKQVNRNKNKYRKRVQRYFPDDPCTNEEEIPSYWSSLPHDILDYTSIFLNLNELRSIFCVCKEWNIISESVLIWQKVWVSMRKSNEAIVFQRERKLEEYKEYIKLSPYHRYYKQLPPNLPKKDLHREKLIEQYKKELSGSQVDYKHIIKSILMNESKIIGCTCVPIKHFHSNNLDFEKDVCYICCHGALLSSLDHAIRLYKGMGFKGPFTCNEEKLEDKDNKSNYYSSSI